MFNVNEFFVVSTLKPKLLELGKSVGLKLYYGIQFREGKINPLRDVRNVY